MTDIAMQGHRVAWITFEDDPVEDIQRRLLAAGASDKKEAAEIRGDDLRQKECYPEWGDRFGSTDRCAKSRCYPTCTTI